MARGRRPQPWLIRLTHWVNVPALVVMAMSGLQILRAYPYFGPQGAQYDWVPLQGWDSPSWMRAGGWLAGARHLHFAFMWLFMGNALVYVAYLAKSGEWRRRFFWPPRDARPAVHQFLRYLRIRKDVVEVDLYNGLQRFAYTGAFVLALLSTLSGLAIWKPVSLHRICWLMGGYDRARTIHFLTLLGLMLFVVAHLVMVVVHWRQFPQMITGGKRVVVPGSEPDAPKPKETKSKTKDAAKVPPTLTDEPTSSHNSTDTSETDEAAAKSVEAKESELAAAKAPTKSAATADDAPTTDVTKAAATSAGTSEVAAKDIETAVPSKSTSTVATSEVVATGVSAEKPAGTSDTGTTPTPQAATEVAAKDVDKSAAASEVAAKDVEKSGATSEVAAKDPDANEAKAIGATDGTAVGSPKPDAKDDKETT